MAEAYLLRQKLERSRYYSGLINFLKSHKLRQPLPKEQEQQLRKLEANQLARQGKWQQAKLVLATQVPAPRTPTSNTLVYTNFRTGVFHRLWK